MAEVAISPGAATPPQRQPWYAVLYIQVLIAIALGVAIGHFYPKFGEQLKPLGDAFIALIKMMIAPVIFCTVVHGIASMSDLKKIGRIGVKTLFYFEAVSTLALVIGLLMGKILQPGVGFNIDPAALDAKAVATYVSRAGQEGVTTHLMNIIPNTFVSAFSGGDLLQVLLVSILTGFAISRMGPLGERVSHAVDAMAQIFFGVIKIIVRAAPIGAFGAMAFTVGAFGVELLWKLVAAGPRLLCDQHPVHRRRSRPDCALRRFLDLPVHRLHQGRIADRGRHVIVGDRVAADDPEDAAAGRLEIGGRPGDPDRLQLQSRRHEHLHDVGHVVPGAGHQHAADDTPGARHSGRSR